MPEVSNRDELRDAVKRELDALLPQFAQSLNWIGVPYSKDNFGANGGMLWTVAEGNQAVYQFLRLSPTILVLAWRVVDTTVAGTVNTTLRIRLPEGAIASKSLVTSAWGRDNGTAATLIASVAAGEPWVSLQRSDVANWAASSRATRVDGQMFCEVVAAIGR